MLSTCPLFVIPLPSSWWCPTRKVKIMMRWVTCFCHLTQLWLTPSATGSRTVSQSWTLTAERHFWNKIPQWWNVCVCVLLYKKTAIHLRKRMLQDHLLWLLLKSKPAVVHSVFSPKSKPSWRKSASTEIPNFTERNQMTVWYKKDVFVSFRQGNISIQHNSLIDNTTA